MDLSVTAEQEQSNNTKEMTELKHRDCEQCSEHKLLEERMKALDKLPKLVSWMNITKGVMLLFTLFMTLFFASVNRTQSETREAQIEHEKSIKEQQKIIVDRMDTICRDISKIEQNVAVMIRTFEMSQKEAAKEREHNTRRIDNLEADLRRNQ